jgi:type I restriction enzyme M protein
VFTHKAEYLKYSRLVSKQEIAEQHDYNLNIRRYVDNTPEPEPEDVKAHLLGGIPPAEVADRGTEYDRFKVDPDSLFAPLRPGYLTFRESIGTKSAIKTTLEADRHLQSTVSQHYETLEAWWQVARDNFARLGEGKKLPEVRRELLMGLKEQLIALGVLDEFQSAGVFVNWWLQIRYDLKTIVNTGWHHTLIPDEYLIGAFFQAEAQQIEDLESQISALQGELSEAVESAQEVASYEPEEDEDDKEKEKAVTAASIKKALKALMDDLKESVGASAQLELDRYQSEYNSIDRLEKRIKVLKADVKTKTTALDLKLRLKRVGGEEFKAETQESIQQVVEQLAALDVNKKEEKKQFNALTKDRDVLAERLTQVDILLTEIGGQMTPAEAKTLILQKLYDWVKEQLTRYLNAAKRTLIALVEKLWDKYAVSSQELEAEREGTLKTLNEYLSKLGYLA